MIKLENLADKPFIAPNKATPVLKVSHLDALIDQLGNGWQVTDGHHLEKTFSMNGMVQGLEFVKKIVDVAEELNHHPDIELTYPYVKISIFTHVVNGLTEGDFILAAKIDRLIK